MKAVILAAGRGKRMDHLTDFCPKSLLEYKGKSLMAHTLDLIPPGCVEIIIVIGYLGDAIRRSIGRFWNSIPIRYVESDMKGTGEALWKAKDFLRDDENFLVCSADDIYVQEDVRRLVSDSPSLLVYAVSHGPVSGGRIVIDEKENLVTIVEGTHQAPFLVSAGMYSLTKDIFNYPLVKISGRDEYGLPQTLIAYAKEFPVRLVEATFWRQIVSSADPVSLPKDFKNFDR
jgi:bifunctional UDP-N-acetylglucosamine pyrophosphorylase/glucosamine-1-phosphate N-acetyltransferase